MTEIINSTIKLDCEELLGTFIDERHYDRLIESDVDFYGVPDVNGDSEKLFVFRKNYFTQEEQDSAYDNLHQAATVSENRGLATGSKEGYLNSNKPGERQFVTNYQWEVMDAIRAGGKSALIDDGDAIKAIRLKYPDDISRRTTAGSSKTFPWVIRRMNGEKIFDFDAWVDSIMPLSKVERVERLDTITTMISTTNFADKCFSGVAGYFDRYVRHPYGRAASYSEKNPKWVLSFPYLRKLSYAYEVLVPERWRRQKECCDKIDQGFVIPGTVFTTVTVNRTFRTAAHRDSGDLSTGFSNLGVVSNGKDFSGGYLIFPEYRVAINVRPGDLLLVNNHEGIHGNTPIVLEEEGANRISLVCYFREGMLECGEKVYEEYRREFTFERYKKANDPRFNGVTPGMFVSGEWYDWLRQKPEGERYLKLYHPEAYNISLEDLF